MQNLIIGLDKPDGKDPELLELYNENYNELVRVAKEEFCDFPLHRIPDEMIENVFGEDCVVFGFSDNPNIANKKNSIQFNQFDYGKMILLFPSGNVIVLHGDNLCVQKAGFIKP